MTAAFCRRITPKVLPTFARRQLYVLGIESSCDDTSASVVSDSKKVLGEGHYSQTRFHVETGGIIPILAYHLHEGAIKNVVETSMKQSMLSYNDLDAIAVTVKPGFPLSLKTGLEHAKDLCTRYSKPLIPIHHMEAHALTARLLEDVKYPYLTLLISGGHCILALVESVNKFKRLGESLQNSPGQVLDRIARRAKLNNLKKFRGLAGGVALEGAAEGGDSSKFNICGMVLQNQTRNCNFSFGFLMTVADFYLSREEKKYNLEPGEVIPNINDFCAAILLAVGRHLCQRLEIAFHYLERRKLLKENEKCLVMSGGVACNKFIRKAVRNVCNNYSYQFVVPPAKLCTDNGTMVAWNGIERLKENLSVVQPDNLSSVTQKSKCPLGEDISEDVEGVGKSLDFKFVKLKSYSEVSALDERSEDYGKKTTEMC